MALPEGAGPAPANGQRRGPSGWRRFLNALSSGIDTGQKVAQVIGAFALLVISVIFIWQSHISHALVVKPFDVPPNFANNELSGTGVAARLRDALNALVVSTDSHSSRTPESVTGNWGDESRIDVSQGEGPFGAIVNGLHAYFAQDVQISGEVYRVRLAGASDTSPLQSGLALTVRIGSSQLPTLTANLTDDPSEDDAIDKLIAQIVYPILDAAQPYRYAIARSDRDCKNLKSSTDAGIQCRLKDVTYLEDRASTAAARERPWLYTKASERLTSLGFAEHGRQDAARAVAIDIGHVPGFLDLAIADGALNHPEQALAELDVAAKLLADCNACDLSQRARSELPPQIAGFRAALLGAHAQTIQDSNIYEPRDCGRLNNDLAAMGVASHYAQMHDPRAARNCIQSVVDRIAASNKADPKHFQPPWDNDGRSLEIAAMPRFSAFADEGNWQGAVSEIENAYRWSQANPVLKDRQRTFLEPFRAYAYAMRGEKGDIDHALALIEKAPDADADYRDYSDPPLFTWPTPRCYTCLELRGLIEAARGNFHEAGIWFGRAITDAPSIPFAYSDWGGMLLKNGDYDGAIAKFQQAHERAPRFADPLEMWGEALMAQNRSDLALAKFAEAEKYAPHWGRLHLKWGEASIWSGQAKEARKQFTIAAGLDLSGLHLSATDKTELARAATH